MDARIEFIMFEIKRNDKSFTEHSILDFIFGESKYKQSQVRDIWFQGIAHGIEIGFREASLEGQKITITNNIDNPRHKEFYDKFLKLAEEYECAIQYHPVHGMVVIDRNFHKNYINQ